MWLIGIVEIFVDTSPISWHSVTKYFVTTSSIIEAKQIICCDLITKDIYIVDAAPAEIAAGQQLCPFGYIITGFAESSWFEADEIII